MYRRPWPFLILAICQLFAPFISVIIQARLQHVSSMDATASLIRNSTVLELLIFFLVPVMLMIAILVSKKLSYFVLLGAIFFTLSLNLKEWFQNYNQTPFLPMFLVVLMNLALFIYFLIPEVRIVFINPRIRWWESKPRYRTNIPGEILFQGFTSPVVIEDLSVGGVGVVARASPDMGSIVEVQWNWSDQLMVMHGKIAYSRSAGSHQKRLGVEWTQNPNENNAKVLRMIRELRSQGAPETRVIPSWRVDLANWVVRAKNPKAWVPEISKNYRDKG